MIDETRIAAFVEKMAERHADAQKFILVTNPKDSYLSAASELRPLFELLGKKSLALTDFQEQRVEAEVEKILEGKWPPQTLKNECGI